MKKFNFDSFVLTTGQMIIFIFASIISCIINLLFIGNLSESSMRVFGVEFPPSVIMLSIAICLELAKLYSITMRNTLEELNRKIKQTYNSGAIKRVARIWFATYIFYAILAVVSAVNFSLGNLGKEDFKMISNIQLINSRISAWNEYESNIENIEKQIKGLKSREANEKLTLDKDYKAELSKWKSRYEILNLVKYNSEYPKGYWGNIKDLSDDDIIQVVAFRLEFGNAYPNVSWQKLSEIERAIKVKYSASDIERRYQEQENEYKSKIEENRKNIESLKMPIVLNKIENGKTIKQEYSIENLNSLNELLLQEKAIQKTEAGTQLSIRLLSDMLQNIFGIKGDLTDILRVSLLLVLSILVEITIFQTSPKIKIDRKLLYQFSRFLPDEFDINKFISDIDQESILFGFEAKENTQDDNSKKITELCEEYDKKYKNKNTYSYTVIEKTPVFGPVINQPTEKVELKAGEGELVNKEGLKASTDNISTSEDKDEVRKVYYQVPKFDEEAAKKAKERMKLTNSIVKEEPPKYDDLKINNYRFGKATEKVKQEFVTFVEALYENCTYDNESKKYHFNEENIKNLSTLSEKHKETIYNRLKDIVYKVNPLDHLNRKVIEIDELGPYSYMNKENCISYITEVNW